MSEQHFREIQLSGKQLVFLFMTSVVVAVGVFLLGVSVGRGVRANTGGPIDGVEESASLVPPAEMPAPTELTPADTGYHDSLQGTTTPPAEPEPISEPVDDEPAAEPAAEAAPATPEVRPQPPAATPPAATPPPAPATQKPAPATQKPAPAVTDGWYLQIGAYRSRQNADRQVQDLKAKGYAAAVAPSAAGGLYRVRVGPFADRAEAVRQQARLKTEEGTGSSVTR
jgi:cell division septation protein DedD